MSVISDIIASDDRAHENPEPIIAVGEISTSSVDLATRVWCNNSNYWTLRWDLLKLAKENFDAKDISIPFLQSDVHLHKATD